MRVAFIYEEMECLGIQYLSSVLKQNGHETRLFFDPRLFSGTSVKDSPLSGCYDYSDHIIQDMKRFAPDLAAFSVLTTNYEWACKLSRKVRDALGIPVVWGGIHVTSLPEEVLKNEFVDYAIVGEGEYALLELVQAIENGKKPFTVRNVWFREGDNLIRNEERPLVKNLDTLPFPDKDLFYDLMPYLQKSYTIVTGRGCPHDCSYCCNSFTNRIYKGNYLRRRSAGGVIKELDWACRKYDIRFIFFDDNTFTYDRKWLRDFVFRYKEAINIPSFCWVHPKDVDTGLIELLKVMNCRSVEMGVESLDAQIRSRILNRHYDNSVVENAIGLFNRNKIFCVVDNIKGLYDNPEKEMSELVSFYNENRAKKIYVFEYRAFPRTRLTENGFRSEGGPGSGVQPFTLDTKATGRNIKKMELLLVFVYFLPKKIVRFILKKRLYRLFPAIDSYNFLEIVPYFVNLFKTRKYRFSYPIRGTRRLYLHYLIRHPVYGIKRMICRQWG